MPGKLQHTQTHRWTGRWTGTHVIAVNKVDGAKHVKAVLEKLNHNVHRRSEQKGAQPRVWAHSHLIRAHGKGERERGGKEEEKKKKKKKREG